LLVNLFTEPQPSGSQTPSRGLALGVKPKARTIYSLLLSWAVEVRTTRLSSQYTLASTYR